MPSLQEITSKSFGGITVGGIVNLVGWLVGIVLVLSVIGFGYYWYLTNKKYNKNIVVCELINGQYVPTFRDKGRAVKIGRGGFEAIYLKKLKTYRIAYGGRIGKDTYYFFIGPDGYWYNGVLGGQLTKDGVIPIITASVNLRAQYTALEKHIEGLYGEQKTFWDKYGNWIISIGFVLIIGVLAWLIFREFGNIVGPMSTLVEKVNELLDRSVNVLANTEQGSGQLSQAA